MKVCEICEQVEACVEVKHFENGELRELSLCAACAQAHGLNLPPNLADLLLESTLQEVAAVPAEADAGGGEQRCPACGLDVLAFRKSGRLGCSQCYQALGDVLEPLLLGMHRSLTYRGTLPVGAVEDPRTLQAALREAVLQEDYETAARLRDRIRAVCAKDVLPEKQREFLFDENH